VRDPIRDLIKFVLVAMIISFLVGVFIWFVVAPAFTESYEGVIIDKSKFSTSRGDTYYSFIIESDGVIREGDVDINDYYNYEIGDWFEWRRFG